ncbi:A/G-specific adenine glycosylase [Lachnoclostridium sp.]|uniref:A/G-specific adenine glycosylase n=1 Tax=Lachnoclostridium sp. TaxID=2028282 RepID=UPI002896A1C9|nr:A/G-specific adenine glycosylase [Lachnoclostridium sp.]
MKYDYRETVEYLLHWYDLNARILEWRSNPKPYYVWISEIMLQQTRVETVKSYFDRFIKELPTIKDLAAVEEDRLMKLWEGLGYYNRARNLKKAAIVVMDQYDGELPANREELKKLPGIGSYTSGAIGSIAFQLPVAAVDGNVLRVMKRIAGSFDDITKEKVKKELEEDIEAIIPKARPGDYNQSLMELGATVCLPNGKPLCDRCPVMHLCNAFHNGDELKIPVKPKKKERAIEEKTVLVMECAGSYAIRKRTERGLLHGLWELPNIEGKLSLNQMEEQIKILAPNAKVERKLGEAKHIFSHKEWHMNGYYIKVERKEDVPLPELIWVDNQTIQKDYSLPTAFEAYRKELF